MLRADGVLHLAETLETRLEDKLGDSSASLEQQLVRPFAYVCLLERLCRHQI
eukprot:COSAG02_NODE_49387_length_327_cov_0.679825_1_plen_52_part_00